MIFKSKFSGASALHTWRTKLKIFINNLVSFLRSDAQNTKKLKKSYTLGALNFLNNLVSFFPKFYFF